MMTLSKGDIPGPDLVMVLPNGSRLSCGRNAGGSKVVEQQTKRPGQRGSAILPYLRAPGSFKRMLGCGISAAPPT